MASTLLHTLLLSILFVIHAHATGEYRICVPHAVYKNCVKMMEDGKAANIPIKCVEARDRQDCIEKLNTNKADFEALDPEDMFNAAEIEKFKIIKEIRTKEEPSAEFRYEAVAVIPKDLNIKDIKDLKGKKSCHTGVGRNVGYKIPLTLLTKMGILQPNNDDSLSTRENELKGFSNLFSQACIVGTWSPHPETNQKLKLKYKNLCMLCEHPEKCDYPDENSGYEGALRCLTKGGDVAWTKVIFVKKFFGMAYGNQPAKPTENDPSKYAYLCPDGTKKPVTGTPCTWAARPWQGFLANKDEAKETKELRELISKLNNLGETEHANWITSVLLLNDKTLTVDNKIMTPVDYLKKAKYYDVIGRDFGNPSHNPKICVTSQKELEKCTDLKTVAFSRDIRPKLECLLKKNAVECMQAVKEKKADIFIADPQEAITAESYNLKALLHEQYNNENKQQLVAVVKKGSQFKDMASLKGKKACLMQTGKSGIAAVLKYLLEKKFLSKTHCPYEKSMTEFFASIQQSSDPVECMIFGQGDVAFVPYSSLHGSVKDDVEILCSDGGRKPVSQASTCGLATLPPKMVLVKNDIPAVNRDEITHALLAAGKLFAEHPEYFLMYGDYKGDANLLFSNHATALIAVTDVVPGFDEYKKLVKDLTVCNA